MLPTRLLATSLLLLLLATACGGDEEKFPGTVDISQELEITAPILNSEIVVGPNRFIIGVLDKDNTPVVDAKVHLVFYEIAGATATKRDEYDAISRVPARDAGLQEQETVTLPDGTRRVIVNAPDTIGVYSAVVNFDKPGDWGVEIQIDSSKPKIQTAVRPRFNVLPRGRTPNIGDQAFPSVNRTVADTDLTKLDSSAKPSPEMHTQTIADAVKSGKPTLVLFAAPGFCTSRFCGPELEIMRKLAPAYAGRVNFIHIEFFQNEGTPQQTPVDTAREWNLNTEPWFFLIDAKGTIAARFEGPTAMDELDQALKQVTPR